MTKLQNAGTPLYISLNKNSIYCVIPRSIKPSDKVGQIGLVFRDRSIRYFKMLFICFAVSANPGRLMQYTLLIDKHSVEINIPVCFLSDFQVWRF